MRKRKYTFYAFQENETAAFAEYLEGMAANGWMLKTVMRNTVQCFERHEPRRLKFSVAVLPDSSEFESRDREEAVTFRAYCEEAGWKLLYGGTLWQIFYSEEEDPIPIETDPRVQLEVQKDLMLSKGRWMPCLLLTGFFLFGICLIVTPVIMYPLRTLIPEKLPVEEYRRLGEFPAGFEVLGFASDPTWHRESERSCLSFYQTETGTKVDADGKAFWLHMTYYESPVSLIIAGTKGYYPREKGNEWVDEPPVQDTYLLSDRNRLFVLSFTKAAGEAELERAIELFAGGEGSDL